ncbi:MAG: hypothetical protein ACI8WB_004509 [Phenylobacterium sp.]|jgi:hypothetical protein
MRANFLHHLTLTNKLKLTFGFIIAGLIVLGTVSFFSLAQVSKISLSVANVDAKQVFNWYELKALANQHRMTIITHVGTSELTDMAVLEKSIHQLEAQLQKDLLQQTAIAKA